MTENRSALTIDEKKTLKKVLIQTLIPFTVYAILLLIICSIVVIGLKNVDSFYNTIYTKISIFIIPYFLFTLLSFRTVIPLIKDLLSKDKISFDEIIINKKTNTNYGWTGNPIENQINKPYFSEYYLVFENSQIDVNKIKFDKLTIGDKITVSKSLYSNVNLGID